MMETLNQPKPAQAKARTAAPAGADDEKVKSALAAFARADADSLPAWLKPIRGNARASVGTLRFPTVQDEEWRFTNIAPVAQLPLHPAADSAARVTEKDIAPFLLDVDCYRLVFVDGHFAPKLSVLPKTPGNVQAGNFRSEWQKTPALERHLGRYAKVDAEFFAALNTAFFHDGAFVSVAADKKAETPVHLLFVGASKDPGATALPRALIVAHRGSQLQVVESHVSLNDAPRVTCAVTELVLEADARIEHCKVQEESESAYHIATVQAVQAGRSQWTSHSIALGSRIARNQVQTLFEAENGEAILNGLYIGRGEQLIDHHTVVDHAKPRCESHEFYHGILANRSHAVFNGKIFVRQDAQKTNAKQTNRNLLLSDDATIDTKPQLEIFADDVKCTHGAAIGQLSDESMFYLRSRGIGVELARRILIQAFAADVIDRIGVDAVRTRLVQVMAKRFEAAQ